MITIRAQAQTQTTSELTGLPDPIRTLTEKTDQLYVSPAWLRVEHDVAAQPPIYAWARTSDGAAAFTPAYRFDSGSNPWPFARPDLFLQQLTGTDAPMTEILPSYVVGGRRPGHSTFLYAGSAHNRRDLLSRTLAATAEEAAQRGAATVAALYCDNHDADLAAAFACHGGVRVPSMPDFALPLPGTVWEDWLASLPRKQRLNENADRRKLDAAQVRFDVRPLTADDIEWIVPLELDVYHRFGNDYLAAEARGLHRAYLDHLGQDALLITAEREGHAVGFVSLVRIGDTAYLRQGGFDQERCGGAPVYFGAVFHTAIQWAYAHGVTALDYSISAGDVKARRGCHRLDRTAWFVPLTSAAETTLRAAGRGPTEPGPQTE